MQTTELVAGRELDSLVAEKVFGARVWDRDGIPWMTRHSPHQRLPNYSTEIAAAWQVAERCDSFTMYRSVGGWVAELSLPKGMAVEAFAETAPLAICRAALAAVNH